MSSGKWRLFCPGLNVVIVKIQVYPILLLDGQSVDFFDAVDISMFPLVAGIVDDKRFEDIILEVYLLIFPCFFL